MDDLGRVPLRALLELSRRGTMAAVARSLGYTPGAVSQQVARLEAAVGQPLVVRAGRTVRLTDAGRVLAEHAEAVLRAEDEALAALRAVAESRTGAAASGRLRVGVFGSAAGVLLAPLVVALAAAHPAVRVTSREVDVDASSAAVRRGDVDVAFGLDYSTAAIAREPGVDLVQLRTERFALATAPGDAAAGRRVPLAATAAWPWVLPPAATHYGRAVRAACRSAGFEPRVVHEVTDTAAALALAARGMGVTPVTPVMAQLARLPLGEVALEEALLRHVVLARHAADADRPTVRAVTEVARAVVGG